MALLQKFREKKFLTTGLIAFALLAFIVTGLVSQMRDTRGVPNAGEVDGNEIDYLDFQKVEGASRTFFSLQYPGQQVPSEYINEYAWNHLSNYSLIKKECEKMGLRMSDEEFEELYNNMIEQISGTDLKIDDEQSFKTMLKEEMLMQKYNQLIVGCLISNDAEVSLADTWQKANQKEIEIASLRYNPSSVTISSDEKQKLFDKEKELYSFKNSGNEVRNYKLIDIVVKPNQTDIDDLSQQMAAQHKQLLNASKSSEVQRIVKESGSEVAYLGKVYRDIEDFPADVQNDLRMDETIGTREVKRGNNAFYTIRLDGIKEYPKEIKYSAIVLKKEQANLKDSILNKLNAGKSMEEIAQTYKLELAKENNGQNGANGQEASTTTLTLKSAYGQVPVEQMDMAIPYAKLNQQIFDLEEGQVNGAFEIPNSQNAQMIVHIIDRGEPVKKYQLSAIYKTIGQDNAYKEAKDVLTKFCSKPHKLQDLQKDLNAAFNNSQNISSSKVYPQYAESNEFVIKQKGLNPQTGRPEMKAIPNSRDVFDWLFLTAANSGEISKVSSFKTTNGLNQEEEHLYAVAFAGIAEDYYLWSYNEAINENLEAELKHDKQAKEFVQKFKGKNMESVKAIEGVEYQDSMTVANIGDGLLTMKAAKLKKGETKTIVGISGVHMVNVKGEGEVSKPASFFQQAQMKKSFADNKAQLYGQNWQKGLIKRSEGYKDERYLRSAQ